MKRATRMERLVIFTIMDEDMDFRSRKSYLSGDLFRNSPFYDRIVPIINTPNMDRVMEEIGLGSIQSKKVRSYARIMDEIVDPMKFLLDLDGNSNTNMDLFVRHCMSCSPPYQSQVDPIRKLNRRK